MVRRMRDAMTAAVVVIVVAALARFVDDLRPPVTGPARVVDGDSLVVDGQDIRLEGIDAPELAQTCLRGEQVWRCGRDAATALRRMVADRHVSCRGREKDRYGRLLAVCNAGGVDLNAAMVKAGYAVAYGNYLADERDARDARRGLWASQFEQPAAWRARHPRAP